MKKRSFNAFAEKDDLCAVFSEFQHSAEIYYVPAYSDCSEASFDDIALIPGLGINRFGSHIGNLQLLALPKSAACRRREYEYSAEGRRLKRFSALCDENSGSILIDLNGVYCGSAIFPTCVSTLHYDDSTAKELYDTLKKLFRRQAAKTVNGYYICGKAYENRAAYRFCTIDIKSPSEYDLTVD